MNREITFRGKNLINGQWIYGGLAEDKEGNFVILPKGKWHRGACVDKDTIGQFTGLRDKNGREIYEGDIVTIESSNIITKGIIKWNVNIGSWCIHLTRDSEIGSTPLVEMILRYDFYIIGNIHDNPELIKEK